MTRAGRRTSALGGMFCMVRVASGRPGTWNTMVVLPGGTSRIRNAPFSCSPPEANGMPSTARLVCWKRATFRCSSPMPGWVT